MTPQWNKVAIYATVLQEHIDHTVTLRLPDGQLVRTSAANLSHSGLKAMLEPPEDKAIKAAPENKSRGDE
jgi:hypothetical protein